MHLQSHWCGNARRVVFLALAVATTIANTVQADQPLPPPLHVTMVAPWWTLHGANLTGVYAYPSGGWNGLGYVRAFGNGYGYGYGVGMGTPWWSNGYSSGGYYGVGSRPQPVWWTFPHAGNPAAVDALARAEQTAGGSPQDHPLAHRHCPICDGWRGLEYWDLNVPGHPPRWLPPQTHPHIVPYGHPGEAARPGTFQPGEPQPGPAAGDEKSPPFADPLLPKGDPTQ